MRVDLDALCTVQETEFRELYLIAHGASKEYTIWAVNPGGVTVRDRRGAVRGHFRSGIPTGTLDLMGFAHGDGLHIEFELKNANTVISPEQTQRMLLLPKLGCVVAFYRIDPTLTIRTNLEAAHQALLDAIAVRRSK